MESVLTVRLDGAVKEQGAAVMQRCGYTPSAAVRRLFDYAVRHDALPFEAQEKPSREEIRRRVAAFDACHTTGPALSDDEVRAQRLGGRYGTDAR